MSNDKDRSVQTRVILDNVDFATDGEVTQIIDLADYPCAVGKFALVGKGTAGTGNLDIVYTTSIDGVNYVAPADTAIISDLLLVAKQTDVAPFTGGGSSFSRFLKFVVTENGTEAITGVSLTLIMQ